MLQDILDSKIQSSLLGFFLVAPERAFSLAEIARRLRLPSLKAAHGLRVLAEEGVVQNFGKHGKRYYIVSARYGLLPKLKSAAKKDGLNYSDELFGAIKNLGQVKAAFLSGIFTGHPNLPVDLLLVGKVNLKKLADFLKAAERLMGQEINYSIMSAEEFRLRRDTFDKFIRDIFDYRHLVVKDEIKSKSAKS